jgi:hypothetical protein
MTRLARLKDIFLPEREPQRALFCTYGFDTRFFESEVIPALFPTSLRLDREAGSQDAYLHAADVALARPAISVFYDHLLGDGPELIYGTWRVDVAPRAFHPKLAVLDYGDVIRVAIGSANLSRSAWTGLLELFVVADLVPRVAHPWADGLKQFVSELIKRIPPDHHKLSLEIPGNLPAVPSASGSARVTSTWSEPLLDALLHGITGVRRVDAVTPFFEGSDGPGVFDELRERIGPQPGRLYTATDDVDGRTRVSGPPEKLRELTSDGRWELHGVNKVWDGDEEGAPLRGLHGKLLGVTHAAGVRLMVGSANLTRAALLHQAPTGNVELVVLQDVAASDLKHALPQATRLRPEGVDFVDRGDPSDEDNESQAGAERYVLEATYRAASDRLSLVFAADAPELEIRYGDALLEGIRADSTWSSPLELAAPRYVTVDDGQRPGMVPFVIVDQEALAPRGNAVVIGLETFFEILAGDREPPTPADGDPRNGASAAMGDAEGVGARGAIPWRRYLAAVTGIGRELERERLNVRGLRFTIENPTRLRGLIDRLHQARDDRRFTGADLLYALYELEHELHRVLALETPDESRDLLAAAATETEQDRTELMAFAGTDVGEQLRILNAMDLG